jgi:amino acid adenylation domain-containing protein/thioester reductase-like protein
MNSANTGPDRLTDGLPDLVVPIPEQIRTRTEEDLISVPEQIERNARLFPDKTALFLGEQTLSYNQLNEKSNQLAARLIQAGVGPETFVCICLGQSVDKVISMLAVLKAGGAYVPIDPNYPAGRIHFILKDTAAPFLITTAALSQKINTTSHTIYMDDQKTIETISRFPTDNPVQHPAMQDLAYVIYTSGSTGQPKGVMIEHGSLTTFTGQHTKVSGITANNKALQFSSTSFDAAVIDLWIPLLTGATLYLYPDNRIIGAALMEFIELHQIDILPLVSPTVLASLPLSGNAGPLKVIGIGGEACPVHTLQHWSEKTTLINSYGPTEATVAVTSFVCHPDRSPKVIGKPGPAAGLFLLDENMQEVATGITGELYIAGPQVARGYLNQPELTAEKFIPNPFSTESTGNSRLYRTGDLMSRLPDGNFEFAGRKDDQVKIRGYRIEPGEIENALNKLEGIRQAVVITREKAPGIMTLAAFIVSEHAEIVSEHTEADTEKSIQQIRKQLQQLLPAYMIPDRIEFITTIPLNAHGKVDKDRLQLTQHSETESLSVAHIDPVDYETIISTVWAQLLHRKKLEKGENFFESGGDSIMLMQVYAALPESLKKNMSIPDFYTYPNAEQLAAAIRRREQSTMLSQKEKEQIIIRELIEDARLKMDFQISEVPDPAILSAPAYIFLTGATGFVGAHLLYELLQQQTGTDIFCLVRAGDAAQAMERLRHTFHKFRLEWNNDQAGKIIPVTGDLSLPFFGMDERCYTLIAEHTDVIYHSGSSVSYLQPYPVIKGANIDGLQEIIRLATTKKVKYLALLSSMGVFSWGRPFTGNTWMTETDNISQNLSAVSKDLGYIKSKWVMEKMMEEAIAKGLPVINFRLGFAVCNGTTGATVMSQWWGSLVRSCVETGAFPLVMGLKDELTTVDYMTKAIVHIAGQQNAVGKNFHLSPKPENDVSMTDFFAKMNEYYGLDLKGMPYQDWMALWKTDIDNPLYPLLSLFTDDVHEGRSLVESYEHTYYYDRSNTEAFLAGTGLEPPVFDRELMTPYLQFMGVLS